MFIENQTVWCAMFGKGVVARISHKGAKFPVVVNFGGLMERCYSLEGEYEQLYATQPTLFPYPIEIVKKITKPSINWDHVAPKYKYLSEDSEGNAFLYEEEPYVATDAFVWYAQSDEVVEAIGFISYTPGTCDWRASLISRPDSD